MPLVRLRLRSNGASLIELSVVLLVIVALVTVLAAAQKFTTRRKAQQTIKELTTISIAAIKYYHKNGSMPSNITDLQDLIEGNINNNPFGSSYSLSSTSWSVTVTTTVPKNSLGYISWGKQMNVISGATADTISITETVDMDMIDGERYDKKNLYNE